MTEANGIVLYGFDKADQVMELRNARAEIVHLGAYSIMRLIFRPGMRYSRDIRPYIPAALEKSPARPVYCQSGHLHFVQPDGSAVEITSGAAYVAPPWDRSFKDSWVVGDEPCVLVSFIPAKIDVPAGGNG